MKQRAENKQRNDRDVSILVAYLNGAKVAELAGGDPPRYLRAARHVKPEEQVAGTKTTG